MHIAFCLFKYFPYGGIQRDFLGMARECLARGMQVRVYTLSWQGDKPEQLDVIEMPVRGFVNHVRYRRFARAVQSHLVDNPVDLVVGMNKMPGLDVYYAGDSCYQEKARQQRSRWYRLTPRYRLFSSFENAVFEAESNTRILSISDREIQFFQKYYGTPASRFRKLPPGLNRDRCRPENYAELRAETRARCRLGADDLLVLFVGSGYIKKGLDRAILAFHALPEPLRVRSKMLVLGEDRSNRFERLISKLELGDRVEILGGRDDVPEYLFAADALVLPAYDELAGIVIVEAIVAGLPLLVTENCGFAPYVVESDAGLIQPEPFVQEDFNRKLIQLLTSPEKYSWQENGVAFADNPNLYRLFEKAVDEFEECMRTGISGSTGYKYSTQHRNAPEVERHCADAGNLPAAVMQRPEQLALCLFKYFPFGGMQRDFRRILKDCLDAGFAVRVYTLSWQGDVPEGVELVTVASSGVTNHTRYERYIRWVRKDLEKRPVDLTLGFNRMPGLDLYYAADPCYAERALEHRNRLYRSTARYRFFTESENSVFSRNALTHILCLSPRQKASFQRYYHTPDQRFSLLSPGIERSRKRPQGADRVRKEFRQRFDLAADVFLLLMIGSGFRTKGVTRSLKALKFLQQHSSRQVRLMVVGQDNPEPYRHLAEQLGVIDRFEIRGGREDIPRFLLGADLLVHPAISENTGNVLLEAMIAGLPVVASAACGYAHYVNEAGAGCVLDEPFDQSQFENRILNILENTQLRRRWSRAGVVFGENESIYRMPQEVLNCIELKLTEKKASLPHREHVSL